MSPGCDPTVTNHTVTYSGLIVECRGAIHGFSDGHLLTPSSRVAGRRCSRLPGNQNRIRGVRFIEPQIIWHIVFMFTPAEPALPQLLIQCVYVVDHLENLFPQHCRPILDDAGRSGPWIARDQPVANHGAKSFAHNFRRYVSFYFSDFTRIVFPVVQMAQNDGGPFALEQVLGDRSHANSLCWRVHLSRPTMLTVGEHEARQGYTFASQYFVPSELVMMRSDRVSSAAALLQSRKQSCVAIPAAGSTFNHTASNYIN